MSAQPVIFRDVTRQKFTVWKSLTFVDGGIADPMPIPPVGWLNRIFIILEGTMNISGSGSFKDTGPWNILDRVTLDLNQNNLAPVDLPGYEVFTSNIAFGERGFRPDRAGCGDTTPHSDQYVAPVANGNNTWRLIYEVPVAVNDGLDFDMGALNLQTTGIVAQLKVNFGRAADVVNNVGTGFTGTALIAYEYYELPPDPDNTSFKQPVICRTIQSTMPITATGDNVYDIPHQGILTGMILGVKLNGARSDSIDEIRVKFNDSETPYVFPRTLARYLQRKRNSVEWPVGVYHLNFFHGMQSVNDSDLRDAINTGRISLPQVIVKVSSTATLGTNNNQLSIVRRILVPLA